MRCGAGDFIAVDRRARRRSCVGAQTTFTFSQCRLFTAKLPKVSVGYHSGAVRKGTRQFSDPLKIHLHNDGEERPELSGALGSFVNLFLLIELSSFLKIS